VIPIRRLALCALAPVALATSGAAHAERPCPDPATVTALKRCRSLSDAAERLTCFDAFVADVTATEASPQRPQDFGLRAAQRPAVEEPPAISAKVVGLGRGASGRPTVELDNGQLWELDAKDPLLAAGDAVTITRGALGSFLLETPSKRTHRAWRQR